MASDYLSKILETEEHAKQIITQAEETWKQTLTDELSKKKEAFRAKEAEHRKQAEAYIENLRNDAEKQMQALITESETIIAKTKAHLDIHKEEMSALIMDFITGKETI